MKRLLALVLVLTMLVCMVPAETLAASKYAAVIGGWLRLRAGASFNAETITSYYTGTVVEILSSSGGWCRVRTPDGRIGYMYDDYLQAVSGSSGSASSDAAYVVSGNGYGVRMRQGPGTGYRVIATYAVGTPVKVLQRGDYWCRISINGVTGYMMTQFLNFGSGSGSGSGTETPVCYATIWSGNGYGVRLRTGPGKGYSKIGVYSVGTSVAVLEKGAVWDRIRVGSRTGWMMNEFLRYQNANEVTGVTLTTLEPVVGTVIGVKSITPSKATVAYQWYIDGKVVGTASTYTVTSADVGKEIRLLVKGTGSYSGAVFSATTKPVISNTQLSGLKLNITAPVVGDVMRATFTPDGATVTYAWKVGGYLAGTAASYTVASVDVGKSIELVVTGTGKYSGTLSASTAPVVASSSITGVIIRNENASAVGAVPVVGDKLTADASPAQATVTYQWTRGGENITAATERSYVLTKADEGKLIGVTVTGTGAYSGARSAVLDKPVAAQPEKPQIEELLLPEGMAGISYATQLIAQGSGQLTWKLVSGKLPDGLELSESGAITGTPVKDGEFTFTVKATNKAGSDEKSFTITIVPVAKPQLTVGSVTIPEETEGYASASTVQVAITNIGKADAHLERLWTQGTHGDCFIVNENGRSVIGAGQTDTTWTVQPKSGLAAGSYQADFVVSYDGGEASASVLFTVKPAAAPEPPTPGAPVLTVGGVTIPEQTEGYADVSPVAVTISNTGDAAAVLEGLWTEGGDAGSFIVNTTGNGKIKAGQTDTSWTIQPKSGLAAGTYQTNFVVKYNGGTASAAVTFTVKAAAAPEPPAPGTPALSVGGVTIPEQTEGYADVSPVAVAISNTGNSDAVLEGLWTEGGDAGSFIVNTTGNGKIKAGQTDTSWTVQPKSGLSAGTYQTNFVVKYNGGTASAAVTFTVKAAPAPEPPVVPAKAVLSVDSVTIPDQTEGYSGAPTVAVTITNTGDGDAELEGLWTEGSDGGCFIVNENGRSQIKAGASDTSWTVQPKDGLAAGTYHADFVVKYSDGTASGAVTFTVKAAPEQQVIQSAPLAIVIEEPVRGRLETPAVEWDPEGMYAEWNAVEFATGYECWYVTANGEELFRDTTSQTRYDFTAAAAAGDVFYVKAVDSSEALRNSAESFAAYQ